VKYRFRRKKIKREFFIFILIVILTLASALGFISTLKLKEKQPLLEIEYNGKKIKFRSDLREADQIKVFNGEKIKEILNPNVTKIYIAYKPSTNDSLYVIEIFEIVPKLLIYYFFPKNVNPKFEAMEVEDYSEVFGTKKEPVIVLVHPDYANSTFVKAEDFKIIISGITAKDLDLATIKFLLIALGIKLS